MAVTFARRWSPMFGRHAELAALRRLRANGERLVSLVGPPGIGKTRLALELAREAPASQWCELGGCSSAMDVAQGVARTLELHLPASDDPAEHLETVGAALAAREPMLLVLDECEGATHAVATAVTLWREQGTSASFLLTSREALNVPGEAVVPVGPLSLTTSALDRGEALELFVDRARRAAPGFDVGPVDAEHIAAIVTALDGIPLAIELAAARVAVLGCAAIRARLARPLELLARAGPTTGVRDRHRTLRDAIDGSWSLLSGAEQRTLAQCAVIPGTFGIEAAEAIVDAGHDAPPVLDLIHGLQSKSLLAVMEADAGDQRCVRYRLLTSIQSFAREKLACSPEDEHAAFARYAEHVLAVATDAVADLLVVHARGVSRGDATGADWALRAAVALEQHFLARGPLRVYLALLDAALSTPFARVSAVYARALCARGHARHWAGVGGAEADLLAALEVARSCRDRALEARALLDGAEAITAVDASVARERFMAARALFQELGDVEGESKSLGGLGAIAFGAGALEEAHRWWEEGLARAGGTVAAEPALRQQGIHLGNLAALHHTRGNVADARHDYERALAIARQLEDRRVMSVHLCNLGLLLQEEGAISAARAHLQEARALAVQIGNIPNVGALTGLLATLDYEQRDLMAARDRYLEALRILRPGSPRGRWFSLFTAGLAGVEATLGRPSRGRELLDGLAADLAAAADPMLARACAIHAAVVDHAEARCALGEADPADDAGCAVAGERALELLTRARASLGNALDDSAGSDDVRTALRIARHTLDDERGPPLMVGTRGRWYRLPCGRRVELARREGMARLLMALADARLAKPGAPVTIPELLEAGWPGEKMLASAGASRVYVALGALRKSGLSKLLSRTSLGYLLSPTVTLLTPLARRTF